MNMISEDKLTKFFVAAFKDVIEPGLNRLQETVDGLVEKVGNMAKDMGDVKSRLTKIDQRLDRQGKVQDELQKKVDFLTAN